MSHLAIPKARDCVEAGADQRGATRFTPMLRAGRFVTECGIDIPCILRDISESGVSCRLFRPMPRDTAISLDTGDGSLKPIELVWERGGQAGFAFPTPIDVAAVLAGIADRPRRPLRFTVDWSATLDCAQGRYKARIHNLSQQGAMIESDAALAIDQTVSLAAASIPEVRVQPRWRHDGCYGLLLHRVTRFDELARLLVAKGPGIPAR